MVARVDEDLGLRPQPAADERRRPPVGKVGRVEARFEELVLDQQPHSGRQSGVDVRETGNQPSVALAQVILTWIVRSVGEPEADDRRADLGSDLHALQAVPYRPLSNSGVRMTDAPEAVPIVAEQVEVDCADA